MHKVWWILILSGILVGAGVFGFKSMKNNDLISVSAVRVGQSDLKSSIHTTGVVKAKRDITIFSTIDGKLIDYSVKVGDTVRNGQIIGKFDNSDLEIKIRQIEAQIEVEKAAFTKLGSAPEPEEVRQLQEEVLQEEIRYQSAKRDFERTQQLYQSGAVSKAEYDQKQDNLQLEESKLQSAKDSLLLKQKGPNPNDIAMEQAKIKELQLQKEQLVMQYQDNKIISPMDGMVISSKVKEGQFVPKGSEVVTIADTKHLEITSTIKQALVRNIHTGQEAMIECDILGNKKLKAKVLRIDPTANLNKINGEEENTKPTVSVTLGILDHTNLLKIGYQVDVSITDNEVHNALQIPYEAVQQEQNGTPFVWVVKGEIAQKRKIETGIKNEVSVEIKKGLQKDEMVIVNPPEGLTNNEEVTLTKK